MASLHTKITYVALPLTCPFDPKGPFELTEGQDLEIEFSGFPSGSTLDQLSLVGVPPTEGFVYFPPQRGTEGIFHITDNGKQPGTGLIITVEDREKPPTDARYKLALTGGNGSGGKWLADPEVINKPGQELGVSP